MPFLSQLRAAPNLLTLLRLLILPFLVLTILHGDYRLAFALILFAGLTDALDGLLARWLSQRTRLGQYLDPIADKLLLSTLFITLTYVGLIPLYVTVLVFARDLGILALASVLYFTGTLNSFRPSRFGKLHTLVQIVTLVLVLFNQVVTTHALTLADDALLRAVAIFAPLSAAEYAWIMLRRLDELEALAAISNAAQKPRASPR